MTPICQLLDEMSNDEAKQKIYNAAKVVSGVEAVDKAETFGDKFRKAKDVAGMVKSFSRQT